MSWRIAGLGLISITIGALGGCTTHEEHLRSDAEVCGLLGHAPGTSEYDICMRALNKRRCEDRSNRDPMCQHT